MVKGYGGDQRTGKQKMTKDKENRRITMAFISENVWDKEQRTEVVDMVDGRPIFKKVLEYGDGFKDTNG